MIQTDNQQKIKIITDLFNTNGYVKGYGAKQYRVMDGKHNPLYNVNRMIINSLIYEGKLKQEGLILKLNIPEQ
jgi:hypothetical protein